MVAPEILAAIATAGDELPARCTREVDLDPSLRPPQKSLFPPVP